MSVVACLWCDHAEVGDGYALQLANHYAGRWKASGAPSLPPALF